MIQSQSSSNYSKNLGTELDQNSYPIGKEKAQTNQSHLVTGRGLSTRNQAEKEQSDIHNENVTKLSQMTEQDILAEKASLEAAIGNCFFIKIFRLIVVPGLLLMCCRNLRKAYMQYRKTFFVLASTILFKNVPRELLSCSSIFWSMKCA